MSLSWTIGRQLELLGSTALTAKQDIDHGFTVAMACWQKAVQQLTLATSKSTLVGHRLVPMVRQIDRYGRGLCARGGLVNGVLHIYNLIL